ncbi:MAG: UPF0758 domain-containing protein, partial [Chloroflexota bacterium]
MSALVEYHPTIKDLPASERPRERLLARGPGELANQDLLAILLRTGLKNENAVAVAQRLLARFGGLEGLARVSAAELSRERGLGDAKAAQLVASLELGRRLANAQPMERMQVRTPGDVARLLTEMEFLEQEHLRVVLLDAKNHVLAVREVYKGAADRATVRVAEVF